MQKRSDKTVERVTLYKCCTVMLVVVVCAGIAFYNIASDVFGDVLFISNYTSYLRNTPLLPPSPSPVLVARINASWSRSMAEQRLVSNSTDQSRQPFQILDDQQWKEFKRLELANSSPQRVSITGVVSGAQPAIKFLPNYKNPCWFDNASGKGDPVLRCIPYFIVPGQAKCGSTLLFRMMQKHHQIVPGHKKEAGLLVRAYESNYRNASITIAKTVQKIQPQHNISWYHPMVTYDSDPAMLSALLKGNGDWSKGAKTRTEAYQLKKLIPHIKVIIIIRDPTFRSYSWYNHFKRSSKSAREFHQQVISATRAWKQCMSEGTGEYHREKCTYKGIYGPGSLASIGRGIYDVFIRNWADVLGLDRFLIIKTEEFDADPGRLLEKMFKFLELEPMKPAVLNAILKEHEYVNKKAYPQGQMLNSTKAILDEFYRPHLKQLTQLLGDEKWMWGH